MMIDHVEVERPEGSYYVLTIAGEGFGDRTGAVSVRSADGVVLQYVNPIKWTDTEIVVETTDATINAGHGLMPGAGATVEVVPLPGMVMEFDVPADASDPVHTGNYDALAEHAASLGIKVDKRWGEDRLRHEIDAAEQSSE
jgi:hypothetical protein